MTQEVVLWCVAERSRGRPLTIRKTFVSILCNEHTDTGGSFTMGKNPTLDEVKAATSAIMRHGSSVHPSHDSSIGLTCESGHQISATHTGALYEDCTGMAIRAACSGGEFVHEW